MPQKNHGWAVRAVAGVVIVGQRYASFAREATVVRKAA
jgi:hypothetical protein